MRPWTRYLRSRTRLQNTLSFQILSFMKRLVEHVQKTVIKSPSGAGRFRL